MPELEDFSPTVGGPRSPGASAREDHADLAHIQQSIMEEQVELWWFREPRKSWLCYSVAVLLILGCALGGVGLLSTTNSVPSEWRLGAGIALCLLALGVLLKQLLSSAVQDMNCIRSRRWVDILRSGGLADLIVVLTAGSAILICGAALLHLALVNHMPKPGHVLNELYTSGVVLLTGGVVAVAGTGVYSLAVILLERTAQGRRLMDRLIGVFTVSGQMERQARRETTSSLNNLI